MDAEFECHTHRNPKSKSTKSERRPKSEVRTRSWPAKKSEGIIWRELADSVFGPVFGFRFSYFGFQAQFDSLFQPSNNPIIHASAPRPRPRQNSRELVPLCG